MAAALLAIPLAACAPADSRSVVTVYSPHGREMLDAFEARFEEQHPEIDMQWVDMGSQSILDRMRSERANPQADVWFGAPAQMFETAAEEGLLAEYVPAWSEAVPAEYRDRETLWWGLYLTPEVIAYNTEAVDSAEAPADWDAVLAPRWRGRVLIRDPLESGTMRTIFGMIVDRSLRETGSEAAGFDWLRRLDAQTKQYVLNPTMLYQMLGRGEGDITLWDLPDIEMLRAYTAYPIDYVIPTSGTPVVVDAVAIVHGGPSREAARAFVDWIGMPEQMALAARRFYRLPATENLPEGALPERLERAKAQITPEPMDWQRFQQKSSEWMRQWDAQVRGQGRAAASGSPR